MRSALSLILCAGLAGAAGGQFSLTVLHNGDGESQIVSAPGNPDFGGVARFKTLADQLRASATTDGVLTIAAGDNFLAGPEYTVGVNDGVFYDAIAFAAIGYDAAAIGNHEFDFGPDVLEQFILESNAAGSTTTFVSTNLDFTGEPGLDALVSGGSISDFQVFDFGGTQVGVIGATTPNLPFISSPRDTVVGDMVAAAVQADINTLQGQGVEIIVLVSHLQGIDEEAAVVAATTGLDIVVAGGGDNLLANSALLVPGDSSQGAYPRIESDMSGRDVAIVSTDGNFKYIGRLIANFDAAGEITSIDPASDPVRVSGIAPDAVAADPALEAGVVDPVVAGVVALDQNVLATSEVSLDGVRNSVRGKETNLGNLIGDAFLYSANLRAASFGLAPADVSFANGGGIRNNNVLPAGDFTELDSFDVLPFLNFLSMVENVSPERLKLICENAYGRITATGPAGSGTGRFAQIGGMTVEFFIGGDEPDYSFDAGNVLNITNPGSRVKRIVLDDGTVIIDNGVVAPTARDVNVAIVDFLARGGDQYPLNDLAFTTLGVTYQQSLAEYVADLGTITAAGYPEGGEGRIVNLWEACPADSNNDGAVDPSDVNAWLALYNAGNTAADNNQDGTVNPADFNAWILDYNAGC